ncbi:DUF2950 family protein [Tropicimonas sp. IMCC6043]|nr:DUF2950 family protein [Tropicimonas sp. IMCC6043]
MRQMSPVFAAALALTLVATPLAAQEAPLYATPQDALDALLPGLAAGDPAAIGAALGPGAEALVEVSDGEIDTGALEALYADWREGYRFVPQEDGSVVIELGADDWPFPVPLARSEAGWSFDIEAGVVEIAAREIGRNELDVLELMETYLEIQREFRQTDHDGDGVMEFASSIISPPGMRSGLYWVGPDSPAGDRTARASLDGFLAPDATEAEHEPYFGYYYRILTGQGENAPGGAMSYMAGDNMVAGHALLAVPADYGESGINSFLINEAGIIWQADLGEETLDIAFEIETLDPDPAAGWARLDELPGG